MYAFVEHDFDDNGRWVEFTDAEALRLRAEKAEAERDALAARLAEIEKGAWGRVTDDDESGYPSFDDWFDAVGCDPLCDWTDGAIVTWERFGPLPSERYRIRRNVDADGCVSYTYEEAAP
jgi:hypothetical protein